MIEQPLSDLMVVELARQVSGPYCAKMLADMGAEVIKVEEPDVGDVTRREGPFPNDVPHPERSGKFLFLNTNKKGVTLNVNTATGRKILRQLLSQADVFVEDNPLRRTKELRLDYENVRKVNPSLVMTSITPFGHTGPYKDYRGYDINISAFGGLSVRQGYPDREPLPLPAEQCLYFGGINAAAATMVALAARDKTGQGQHVDISTSQLFSCFMSQGVAIYLFWDAVAMRAGHRLQMAYPYTVLPCKDGYVKLITIVEKHWEKFLELIGNPEWGKDPRFETAIKRWQCADELDGLLAPWLMSHTKEEIYRLCRENGIPFAPVQTIEEVVENEHLAERDFFVEIEHPETGLLKYPGAPYKFSKTPWMIGRPAPFLGEHNEEVYCKRLGYSEQDLIDLRRTGVI